MRKVRFATPSRLATTLENKLVDTQEGSVSNPSPKGSESQTPMESLSTAESKNIVKMLFMNSLGEAVLIQAFQDALFYVANSDHRTSKARKESYMFIKGTSLEITIQEYSLNYDADTLRNQFFWKVRHVKNP